MSWEIQKRCTNKRPLSHLRWEVKPAFDQEKAARPVKRPSQSHLINGLDRGKPKQKSRESENILIFGIITKKSILHTKSKGSNHQTCILVDWTQIFCYKDKMDTNMFTMSQILIKSKKEKILENSSEHPGAAVVGLPHQVERRTKASAASSGRHNQPTWPACRNLSAKDISSVPTRKFRFSKDELWLLRQKMRGFATFLLSTVCPLILGKPQYGAAPVQTPVAAPQINQAPQISCITTQETVRHLFIWISRLYWILNFVDLGHPVHWEDGEGVPPGADTAVQTILPDSLQELLSNRQQTGEIKTTEITLFENPASTLIVKSARIHFRCAANSIGRSPNLTQRQSAAAR